MVELWAWKYPNARADYHTADTCLRPASLFSPITTNHFDDDARGEEGVEEDCVEIGYDWGEGFEGEGLFGEGEESVESCEGGVLVVG